LSKTKKIIVLAVIFVSPVEAKPVRDLLLIC